MLLWDCVHDYHPIASYFTSRIRELGKIRSPWELRHSLGTAPLNLQDLGLLLFHLKCAFSLVVLKSGHHCTKQQHLAFCLHDGCWTVDTNNGKHGMTIDWIMSCVQLFTLTRSWGAPHPKETWWITRVLCCADQVWIVCRSFHGGVSLMKFPR